MPKYQGFDTVLCTLFFEILLKKRFRRMLSNKAFLGINLDLLENPKYKNLDTRAAILYSVYADRSAASLHNLQQGNTAFCDAHGVFIRFSNDFAAKIIRVSEKTISKFRKQLADLGLIEVIRDGLKGYKIYVKEVQPTPKGVDLLMPWKNHTVSIKKSVNDWTTLAKIDFVENLHSNTDMTVKEDSSTTYQKNLPTSLSHTSLSHEYINNGLVGNARVRESKPQSELTKSNTNPYNSLPEKIKSSFADTFGFITKPMALELHSLIKHSSEDMVNYVITSSKGRKITNAIAYIKGAITNALKRGAKSVQDMVEYYEQNVKSQSLHIRPKFMSKKQVEKNAKASEEAFAKENPDKWNQILAKRNAPKPTIPVFKLSTEPRIPVFNLG